MDGADESQIRHVSPLGAGRMLKILGLLARSAQPLSLTRRARGRRVRHRCDGDDDAYIRRVSPLGAGRMVGIHLIRRARGRRIWPERGRVAWRAADSDREEESQAAGDQRAVALCRQVATRTRETRAVSVKP